MATVTVTRNITFQNGNTVTAADLNTLGSPTVTVTGIATADIQAGAITTPLIAEAAINSILNTIYPVGSIYISISDVHPNVGSWTRISEGTVLVGYKQSDSDFNTVTGNKNGGNKTIEVADHNHSVSGNEELGSRIIQSTSNIDDYIQPSGGFTANIMNPYTVVYMFMRIS